MLSDGKQWGVCIDYRFNYNLPAPCLEQAEGDVVITQVQRKNFQVFAFLISQTSGDQCFEAAEIRLLAGKVIPGASAPARCLQQGTAPPPPRHGHAQKPASPGRQSGTHTVPPQQGRDG